MKKFPHSIGEILIRKALPLLLLSQLTLPPAVKGQDGALPSTPPAEAHHAMVVSVHHLASDAGLQMLQAGATQSTPPSPLGLR